MSRLPHDIFLAYSSTDEALARLVKAELERAAIRCWFAPTGVPAGDAWAGKILAAIADCRAMVVLFSRQANESPHVQREVAYAVKQKRRIVVFRIDDSKPTGEMYYYVSTLQWLDGHTPPFEDRLAELQAELEQIVASHGTEPDATATRPMLDDRGAAQTSRTAGPSSRRAARPWRTLAWAGLVALAAVGAWLVVDRARDRSVGQASTGPTGSATAFLAGWAVPIGEAQDPATGHPVAIRRSRDGMRMLLVPAGSFQMGAVASDGSAHEDERPAHVVTLSRAYYLDEHEVTLGQYASYCTATGMENPKREAGSTDRHPVVHLTWRAAKDYAAWVGGALPTEAQFERAVRAGESGHVYPWGDAATPPPRSGNYADEAARRLGSSAVTELIASYDDGFPAAAPVMSFQPNRYGLYDLSGNVWEMCADTFDKRFYERSGGIDPLATDPTEAYSSRGGSYVNSTWHLRCSYRGDQIANWGDHAIGFRCCRTLP